MASESVTLRPTYCWPRSLSAVVRIGLADVMGEAAADVECDHGERAEGDELPDHAIEAEPGEEGDGCCGNAEPEEVQAGHHDFKAHQRKREDEPEPGCEPSSS